MFYERKIVKNVQGELPESELPRTKLVNYGPSGLSDAELMSVLITCGGTQAQALACSHRLLELSGGRLGTLFQMRREELKSVGGIGDVRACIICAAGELSRRSAAAVPKRSVCVDSPSVVASLFMEDMRYLKKEKFRVALLNVKNDLMSFCDVSIGGLSSASANPREVFSEAVRTGAHAIILAHNHPSGDPTPSASDMNATLQLVQAGKILGIPVLDHVVIGDGRFYSFRQEGKIG